MFGGENNPVTFNKKGNQTSLLATPDSPEFWQQPKMTRLAIMENADSEEDKKKKKSIIYWIDCTELHVEKWVPDLCTRQLMLWSIRCECSYPVLIFQRKKKTDTGTMKSEKYLLNLSHSHRDNSQIYLSLPYFSCLIHSHISASLSDISSWMCSRSYFNFHLLALWCVKYIKLDSLTHW